MRRSNGTAIDTGSIRRLQSNGNNRAPLYHQIYLILRSRILDGEYGPGDYLPGERELETMFQVSRITSVRALNELAAAGLVVRERGRGTRVQWVGSGIVSRGPAELTSHDEKIMRGSPQDVFNALRGDRKSSVEVHEFGYVEATPSAAAALSIEQGSIVQRAARVWRFEELPFNYVVTFVPENIGRLWTRADLEKKPLGDLLEQHKFEIRLVQERVSATLADTLLSTRLDVDLGSPILKIERTAFDPKGRAIEHLIGFYPPDRYQYEVTLPRQNAAGRSKAKPRIGKAAAKQGDRKPARRKA